MANIYVHDDGRYDRSRWLAVSHVGPNSLLFELCDLCQPGRVSTIEQVVLEVDAVLSTMRNGAVQVANGRGYFLMRRAEDEMTLEFRGHDDGSASRATILCDDLAAAVQAQPCEQRASAI